MSKLKQMFDREGYLRFPASEPMQRWAAAARVGGVAALTDPAHAHWWRHGRTWFVGVDALSNAGEGSVGGGPPLAGSAIEFVREELGFAQPWHNAQVSACFPGYPKRDESESETAHRFRLTRDAAHVDGLHGEGPERRRHMREFHDFILGLPLTEADAAAAPLVVWAGSHIIMQEMLRNLFAGRAPESWGDVDATDAYQEARRRCFAQCPRIELPAQPGEATLVHRFALHGVAPWGEGATASPHGRMIAYFRPETADKEKWLHAS